MVCASSRNSSRQSRALERLKVSGDEGVGREHEIAGVDVVEALLAVAALQSQHAADLERIFPPRGANWP